jgi:hypothetical protein
MPACGIQLGRESSSSRSIPVSALSEDAEGTRKVAGWGKQSAGFRVSRKTNFITARSRGDYRNADHVTESPRRRDTSAVARDGCGLMRPPSATNYFLEELTKGARDRLILISLF